MVIKDGLHVDASLIYDSGHPGATHELRNIVASVQVDDEKIRAQLAGFDSMERPFIFVPRGTSTGVEWERQELAYDRTFGGTDHYQVFLDIKTVDYATIRTYGIAFG